VKENKIYNAPIDPPVHGESEPYKANMSYYVIVAISKLEKLA